MAKISKISYEGLCKKLVGAIAVCQEARRGKEFEMTKTKRIEAFKDAIRELEDYDNTKVSIDFLVDRAYNAVPELTKKQIYDKIRWLIKNAEISTESGNHYYGRWHRHGDGTLRKAPAQTSLNFLAV